MSTTINAVVGVKIKIIVKQGETLLRKLSFVDLNSADVPLPPGLQITFSMPGRTDIVLTSSNYLTISGKSVVINYPLTLAVGYWTITSFVSGATYPTFKIEGKLIVK